MNIDMETPINYTEQRKEITEALESLFKTMRKYKPGNGLTVTEKKEIVMATIKDMPNNWELEQRLSNRFNL